MGIGFPAGHQGDALVHRNTHGNHGTPHPDVFIDPTQRPTGQAIHNGEAHSVDAQRLPRRIRPDACFKRFVFIKRQQSDDVVQNVGQLLHPIGP